MTASVADVCIVTVVRDGEHGRAFRVRAKPTLPISALARQYAKRVGGGFRLEGLNGRAIEPKATVGSLDGATTADGAMLRAVREASAAAESTADGAMPCAVLDAPAPAESTVVAGGRYLVAGLRGRPELNGMSAVVDRVEGARCVCRVPGVAGELSIKPANLAPCPFLVKELPGRGFGCVAARAVRRGERLFAERPAMTAATTEDHVASALGAGDAAAFWDLHDCHAGAGAARSLLGICRTRGRGAPRGKDSLELARPVYP